MGAVGLNLILIMRALAFLFTLLVPAYHCKDCEDFIVGACQNDDTIQTVPTNDPLACEHLCNSIDDCTYWAVFGGECKLFVHDILDSCDMNGGDMNTNIEVCLGQSAADCGDLVEVDCSMSGEELYIDPTVDDAAACLDYLLILGPSLGATYFTYDRFGTCHLWDTSARVCDGMSGPDGELWEICQDPNTDTPPPTPTQGPTKPPGEVTFTFITLNAINNAKLAGVEICHHTTTAPTDECVLTDGSGRAVITVQEVFPTTLAFTLTKSGFITFTDSTTLTDDSADVSRTVALTPELPPDVTQRVVMGWEHLPLDLDLHVLQYSITEPSRQPCETFYGNKDGCSGLTLDVDNTHGGENGVETISWTKPGENWYLLFVHDYSGTDNGGQNKLTDSKAHMAIYSKSNNTMITEDVLTTDPNERSYYWVFGCFQGPADLASFVKLNVLLKDHPLGQFTSC